MICVVCDGKCGDTILEVDIKGDLSPAFRPCDYCRGAGKLDSRGNCLNGMYYDTQDKRYVSYSQGTLYWSGGKCPAGNAEWHKKIKETRSI